MKNNYTFQTLLEIFCQYTELTDIQLAYIIDADIRDEIVVFNYPFEFYIDSCDRKQRLHGMFIIDGEMLDLKTNCNEYVKFQQIHPIMVESLMSRHRLNIS